MGDSGVVLTLKHIGVMRSFFGFLKELVETVACKVVVRPDFKGIEVLQLDKFHVCAIVANLECDVGGVSPGEAFTVHFHTKKAHRIFKKARDENVLEIHVPNEGSDIFFFEKNPIGQGVLRSKELKKIESDYETIDIPDIVYKTRLQISLAELRDIIEDGVREESDIFNITVERAPFESVLVNKIIFRTFGEIPSKVEYKTVHDAGDVETIVIDEMSNNRDDLPEPVAPWSTVYDFKFTIKFLKPLLELATQELLLFLDNNVPLRIHYPIDDTSFVSLFVSPKMQEE